MVKLAMAPDCEEYDNKTHQRDGHGLRDCSGGDQADAQTSNIKGYCSSTTLVSQF